MSHNNLHNVLRTLADKLIEVASNADNAETRVARLETARVSFGSNQTIDPVGQQAANKLADSAIAAIHIAATPKKRGWPKGKPRKKRKT